MNKDIKNTNEQEAWMKRLRERLEDYSEPTGSSAWEQIEKDMLAPHHPSVAPHHTLFHRTSWAIAAMLLLLVGVSSLLWFVLTPANDTIQRGNVTANAVVDNHQSAVQQTVLSAGKQSSSTATATSLSSASPVRKSSFIARANNNLSAQSEPASNTSENVVSEKPSARDTMRLCEPAVRRDTRIIQGNPYAKNTPKKDMENKNKADAKKKNYRDIEARNRQMYIGFGRQHYPTSFGVNMGSNGIGTNLNSANADASDMYFSNILSNGNITSAPVFLDGYDYEHLMPISFGLTVRKSLPHHLSVESGIVYTLLQSRLKSGSVKIGNQQLHYIGIPVKGSWNFVDKPKTKLYLSGGGMVEKCIYAKIKGKKITVNELQYSVNAGIGIEYDVAKHTGIYFETGVSNYFDNNSPVESYRTENPTSLYFQGGLRFSY
jgi:hypothetical protein